MPPDIVPYMRQPAILAPIAMVGATVLSFFNPEHFKNSMDTAFHLLFYWLTKSESYSRDLTMFFDRIGWVLLLLVLFLGWWFNPNIKFKMALFFGSIVCFLLVFHHQQKLSDFQSEDFDKLLAPIYRDWFHEQSRRQCKASGNCPGDTTQYGLQNKKPPAMPTIRYRTVVDACSTTELARLVEEMQFTTDTMLDWTMLCWTDSELQGKDFCENLKRVYSNEVRVSVEDLQHYCPHQLGDVTQFASGVFILVLALHILSVNFPTQHILSVNFPTQHILSVNFPTQTLRVWSARAYQTLLVSLLDIQARTRVSLARAHHMLREWWWGCPLPELLTPY
ncbi:hypothetical protein T484DRAFT_1757681 [Baffinella frigidus]|nr:hypothetical protein T484DRAFT_1757681 [Cryptophyta sp. CCMP2293]